MLEFRGLAEPPIFQDENVTITPTRAVLGRTTYAIASITSVRAYREPRQLGGTGLAGLAGFVGGALGVLAGSFWAWFVLLAGAGLLIGWYVFAPQRCWVRIVTAAGETNAVGSHDAASIASIVLALNEAIARTGLDALTPRTELAAGR